MDANQLLEQIKNSRFIDGDGVISDALPVVEEYSKQRVEVALITDAEKRKELSQLLKEKENYSNESYVSCVDEELLKVIPLMQLEEAGLVMRLLAYISAEDGVIRDKNGYLHMDKIVHLAGVSESTVKRYVANLVNLGVLNKAGRDNRKIYYSFSQHIHSRKGGHKEYFTKLWLSNLKERWIKLPLKTLGFLYRIMPYFNTYSCCLSANPYEYDVARSIPFSVSALAEVLSMDKKDVSKHVNLLTRNNLVLKVSVGRSFIICVNPQVFYRKPVENGRTVARDYELLFKQAEFISENADDILAMRRFLRTADEIEKGKGIH